MLLFFYDEMDKDFAVFWTETEMLHYCGACNFTGSLSKRGKNIRQFQEKTIITGIFEKRFTHVTL